MSHEDREKVKDGHALLTPELGEDLIDLVRACLK
jgi:hypothetical protein